MKTLTDKQKIQKAIELLEAVPTEQFMTGSFTNCKDQCCGWGHLNRLGSEDPTMYDEGNCINGFGDSVEFIVSGNSLISIARANDKITDEYPQETSKERVLALLRHVNTLI